MTTWLQRRGLYPAPAGQSPILGLEASGVIERVAPGVTKWKVGDRVMALLSGKLLLKKSPTTTLLAFWKSQTPAKIQGMCIIIV